MAKLDADMQSLVRRTILCFAATINGDGSPNLSPKSTLILHDEHHLLFANICGCWTGTYYTSPVFGNDAYPPPRPDRPAHRHVHKKQ
jgi:hypothetical protein